MNLFDLNVGDSACISRVPTDDDALRVVQTGMVVGMIVSCEEKTVQYMVVKVDNMKIGMHCETAKKFEVIDVTKDS
jgi:hypothetical protein